MADDNVPHQVKRSPLIDILNQAGELGTHAPLPPPPEKHSGSHFADPPANWNIDHKSGGPGYKYTEPSTPPPAGSSVGSIVWDYWKPAWPGNNRDTWHGETKYIGGYREPKPKKGKGGPDYLPDPNPGYHWDYPKPTGGSSSIWKLFPTHGNYGGPNWSAAEWGGNPLSEDAPGAVSVYDEAYRKHDIGYALADSVDDVRGADADLARDLIIELANPANWANEPAGTIYSTLALGAFSLKDLAHRSGLNLGTV